MGQRLPNIVIAINYCHPPTLRAMHYFVNDSGEDDLQREEAVAGVEKAEIAAVTPLRRKRRVSFADVAGVSESGVTTAYGENQQRHHFLSLIDGGYHENDHDDERRGSTGARARQQASALIHAAHELMFAGTRPDGLRPITGAPTRNGVSLRERGGIFVGMAGLRGFDLSFLGAQNDSIGTGNITTPASQSGVDMTAIPGAGRPAAAESRENVVAHESTPVGQEQLEQVSLLDRAPGSLTPGTSTQIGSPTASSRDGSAEVRSDDADSSSQTSVPPTPSSLGMMNPPKSEGSERSLTVRHARNGIDATMGTQIHTSDASAGRVFSAPKPAFPWSTSTMDVEDLVKSANTAVGHSGIDPCLCQSLLSTQSRLSEVRTLQRTLLVNPSKRANVSHSVVVDNDNVQK